MKKKQTEAEASSSAPAKIKSPRTRGKGNGIAETGASLASTPTENPSPAPAEATGSGLAKPKRVSTQRKSAHPVSTGTAPSEPAAVGMKTPARPKRTTKTVTEPVAQPAAAAPSEPKTTAQMIVEKRETPIQIPIPKSVREPAQPMVARAPDSGPAALASAASPAKPSTEAQPEKSKPKFELPKILFEGDEAPAPPPTSGPGHKYAVGPTAAAQTQPERAQTLPQRLGSGNLTLTPRDPHSLFAHWDLSIDQQRGYLADVTARHLSVRLRTPGADGPVISEAAVLAGSRHWFLHAPQGGTRYVAELGYYLTAGEWISIATSTPATTPSETFSQDRTVRFAEMPPPAEVPRISLPTGEHHHEDHHPAWAPEAQQVQWTAPAGSYELLPPPRSVMAESENAWTLAQEHAVEEIVAAMIVRQEWFDSFQLVEMIEQQRGGRERIPGAPAKRPIAVELPGPSSLELLGPQPGAESISSPFGIEQEKARRDFWFNVNAELIIYGASEPNARVTIGGREIKLRPDGTFSYRFALPDGQFDLPAEAVSVDDDHRRAELRFSRETKYQGEVGAHPQDPRLKIPAAENVA